MGTFLPRGPIKYHGRPFTGISERYFNGGSGNGAALSLGFLLGEPGGGSQQSYSKCTLVIQSLSKPGLPTSSME